MKSDNNDLNGSYINDALKCSTLDISGVNKDDAEPVGASKGSNEYIREYDFDALVLSSTFICTERLLVFVM